MHGEPYPPPTEFLTWLDPYVGCWLLRETTFEIERRADGWLEVSSPQGAKVSLTYLLKFGKKVGELDQPLGTRPVLLNYPLMEAWMNEEELNTYRHAFHVSIGRKRILELIEQRIREAPREVRLAFFKKRWAAEAAASSIPYEDGALYSKLFDKFRGPRLLPGVKRCRYVSHDASRVVRIRIPAVRPRSARFVGSAEWSCSPMHSRQDTFFLSLDKSRQNWLLWFEWDWEGERSSRVCAYTKAKGLKASEAARSLISRYYCGEEQEFEWVGRPSEVIEGIVSNAVWMEVVEALWPST